MVVCSALWHEIQICGVWLKEGDLPSGVSARVDDVSVRCLFALGEERRSALETDCQE